MTTIHILDDADQAADSLCEYIVDCAERWTVRGQRFSLALSGGTTPRLTYQRLAENLPESKVDQSLLEILWSDERCVPLDDDRSNYHLAETTWLSRSAIPAGNIHPVRCGQDPDRAARAYADLLRARIETGELPRIDLILLGLGPDGHTASLFPGDPGVEEQEDLVVAVPSGPDGLARVSFAPPLINAAKSVAFLVTGPGKAQMVRRIIEGVHAPSQLPAQVVDPDPGELHWFLDLAAASGIRPSKKRTDRGEAE